MKKAGDIVTALFREKFGPEFMDTARLTTGLFSSWVQLVKEVWPQSEQDDSDNPGFEDVPAVAVHSRIRELERGILLVEADHPGWIQILQTKQSALLSAVQRRYQELNIRGIAFRLSREPFSSPDVEELLTTAKDEKKNEKAEPIPEPVQEKKEPPSSEPGGVTAPEDKEFYAALKNLKKSVQERNRKHVNL
jgi:hypothetical protein